MKNNFFFVLTDYILLRSRYFGDIETPFEYVTSSDIPQIDKKFRSRPTIVKNLRLKVKTDNYGVFVINASSTALKIRLSWFALLTTFKLSSSESDC